jgi:hypothetical protein
MYKHSRRYWGLAAISLLATLLALALIFCPA